MIETVLPLALVIAASPVPILPAVLLLMSSRGLANAWPYLLAWLGALAALITVAVLVGEATYGDAADDRGTGWVKLAVGVALLLLAGLKLVKGRPAEPPSWMSQLADYTPARSARLGTVLAAANPKNVLMAAAAGAEIAALSAGPGQAALAAAVFVLVASLGAAVPIVAGTVLGERAHPVLRRGQAWLERYGHAVGVAILGALGAVLVGQGLVGQ